MTNKTFIALLLAAAATLPACTLEPIADPKPDSWSVFDETNNDTPGEYVPDEVLNATYNSVTASYDSYDNLSAYYSGYYTNHGLESFYWYPMILHPDPSDIRYDRQRYDIMRNQSGVPIQYQYDIYADVFEDEYGYEQIQTKTVFCSVNAWDNEHNVITKMTETIVDNSTQDTIEVNNNVYEYDEKGYLTRIVKTDREGRETVYEMKWQNGDLIQSNSEYYGTHSYTYSDVVNSTGHWDILLPFVGPLQAWGWYGKAPKHYVKTVESRQISYELNYNISNWLISERIATTPMGNEYLSHYSFNL